jgi:predicted AlkP superfamily pyrophosphatase or phosphodiesterase
MATCLRSLVFVALLFSCSTLRSQPTKDSPSLPKLGVVIVIDQMTPDYLTRFDALYTGGFRRLLDSGAVFLQAIHDHAATETAVGHTTLSTGCLPMHHGIIGNEFYDRQAKHDVGAVSDTISPLVGVATGRGASPHRILTPSLGEYLKRTSPSSHVYSMAVKDRSAIGMGGKIADGIYWMSFVAGNYVTSSYYTKALPAWVDSFNAARQIDSYYPLGWQKMLPEAAYAISNPDASPNENDGVHTTFPHTFTEFSPQPDKTYWEELYGTPFMDEMTINLARTAVQYGSLGTDDKVDLLWIGCSAADAAGHTYGPNSQEMQDFYLHLDAYLGSFFNYLDSTVGHNNYVVALSSDHGVLPLPEDLKAKGIEAGRIHPDSIKADLKVVGERIASQNSYAKSPIAEGIGDLILDYSSMSTPDEAALQQLVAKEVRTLPYVADVFTRAELADPTTKDRPNLNRFRHCYHADRGPDLFVLFKKNYLIDRDQFGTSHGTPYDYDCTVPIIFSGPGVSEGKYDDPIRTIDFAPTLAALLRIHIEGKMDGEIVKRALDL